MEQLQSLDSVPATPSFSDDADASTTFGESMTKDFDTIHTHDHDLIDLFREFTEGRDFDSLDSSESPEPDSTATGQSNTVTGFISRTNHAEEVQSLTAIRTPHTHGESIRSPPSSTEGLQQSLSADSVDIRGLLAGCTSRSKLSQSSMVTSHTSTIGHSSNKGFSMSRPEPVEVPSAPEHSSLPSHLGSLDSSKPASSTAEEDASTTPGFVMASDSLPSSSVPLQAASTDPPNPTPGSAGSPSPPQNSTVTRVTPSSEQEPSPITVQFVAGQAECDYVWPRYHPLGRIIEHACEQFNVSFRLCRFLFEGERVYSNTTIQSLDVDDNERHIKIDVVQEQKGGGNIRYLEKRKLLLGRRSKGGVVKMVGALMMYPTLDKTFT